jgi:lactate dehydrogenase-like 2-hydroxyacid dehydrogenase
MKFKKLIVLDKHTFSEKQQEELKKLAEKFEIYNDIPQTNQEIIKRIGNSDGVIVNWTSLGKEVFDACKDIKYIGVVATGYGWLDVPYAVKKDIVVTNVPAYSTESVAELVFGQLISLMRKTHEAETITRSGKFEQTGLQGRELQGKTIGIVGLGNIGKRVAEIAQAFGMNVIYWNRTRKPDFENKGIKYSDLEDLFRQSDIVTVHLASTPETRELVGEKHFSKLKERSIFVNMASGDVIDENALIKFLEKGKIKAIFDVYENHKPKETFIKNKNMLLTPEIGFFTEESLNRLNDIAIENARSYLEGKIQNKVATAIRQDEKEQEKIEDY